MRGIVNPSQGGFPLYKLFPNCITLLGICAGLTSIKFTFAGKWEMAVILIIVAAILDGLDGRLARLLNSTSEFGAHLDSLADSLSFGVAPAFLLYFWELKKLQVLGWGLTMVFIICITIRLARFNTLSFKGDSKDSWKKLFFSGVPAPGGALLALTPIMLSFNNEEIGWLSYLVLESYNLVFYLIIVAILIVSRLPTYSAKYFNIPRYLDSLAILALGVLIVFFITKPWISIPFMCLAYLLSIPVSCVYYCYLSNKNCKANL